MIVDNDDISPSHVSDIELSPTGRALFYRDTRASHDPESDCYHPGTTDLWSYKSLLNLTADLHARPAGPNGGIELHGTASDLNFSHYELEYATHASPDVWRPIQPATGEPVINATFTTWLPPAPGTYWVRLTATDLAGNQRRQTVNVDSQETLSITGLHRTLALFSPNGDGVLDDVTIRYRVMQPVHLTFDIYDDTGERVRTITRDHVVADAEQALVWDGRDEQGLVLPDGSYRVAVQHLSLSVAIDATPPDVQLALDVPYQSRALNGTSQIAAIDPGLTWAVTEPNLLDIAIEKAPIGRLNQWQPFIELRPNERTGDGNIHDRDLRLEDVEQTQFRLIAEDRAGNRTEVRRASVPQLIIDGFGDHQRNERAAACGTALMNDDSDTATCIRERGGYYQALEPVPFVPLETFGVPNSAISVTQHQVRFAIAENLATPLERLIVQFAPVQNTTDTAPVSIAWQSVELTTFLEPSSPHHILTRPSNRRLEAVWELPDLLGGQAYLARLKGIDQDGRVSNSNVVMFMVQLELLMKGRILGSSVEEIEQYRLPLATRHEGYTGYWGLNVSGRTLREVRFVLRSEAYLGGGYDPRYPVEQVVDRLDDPGGEALVFEADVTPCKGYVGHLIGTTVSGVTIRSQRQRFLTPCLDLRTQQLSDVMGLKNNDIRLRPYR